MHSNYINILGDINNYDVYSDNLCLCSQMLLIITLCCEFLTKFCTFICIKRTSADIYMRPYTRIGPYLVGMAYGYLLHRNKCKMVINNVSSFLFFSLSLTCLIQL